MQSSLSQIRILKLNQISIQNLRILVYGRKQVDIVKKSESKRIINDDKRDMDGERKYEKIMIIEENSVIKEMKRKNQFLPTQAWDK